MVANVWKLHHVLQKLETHFQVHFDYLFREATVCICRMVINNNNCGVYKSYIRDLVAKEDTRFDLILSPKNLKFWAHFFLPSSLDFLFTSPSSAEHTHILNSKDYVRQREVKIAKFQIFCDLMILLNERKRRSGMRNRSGLRLGIGTLQKKRNQNENYLPVKVEQQSMAMCTVDGRHGNFGRMNLLWRLGSHTLYKYFDDDLFDGGYSWTAEGKICASRFFLRFVWYV